MSSAWAALVRRALDVTDARSSRRDASSFRREHRTSYVAEARSSRVETLRVKIERPEIEVWDVEQYARLLASAKLEGADWYAAPPSEDVEQVARPEHELIVGLDAAPVRLEVSAHERVDH